MKPAFTIRQQSPIYVGPAADLLPGLLPEGRVVVVCDATIDRLYGPLFQGRDRMLIGSGESIKDRKSVV